MCAGAIVLARIPRVVYGTADPKAGAAGSRPRHPRRAPPQPPPGGRRRRPPARVRRAPARLLRRSTALSRYPPGRTPGGVREWLNRAVSKTVERVTPVPRVRIPPPPLQSRDPSRGCGFRRARLCVQAASSSPRRSSLLGCGNNATAAPRWRALKPSKLERTEVAAARVGNRIYVVGGFVSAGHTTAAVERYDIAANRWSRARSMPVGAQPRGDRRLPRDMYVIGGYEDPNRATAHLLRYDPDKRPLDESSRRCRPSAARSPRA